MQVAEEALARPAEREVGHRRGDADVDPDVAHFRLERNLRAFAPLVVKRQAWLP